MKTKPYTVILLFLLACQTLISAKGIYIREGAKMTVEKAYIHSVRMDIHIEAEAGLTMDSLSALSVNNASYIADNTSYIPKLISAGKTELRTDSLYANAVLIKSGTLDITNSLLITPLLQGESKDNRIISSSGTGEIHTPIIKTITAKRNLIGLNITPTGVIQSLQVRRVYQPINKGSQQNIGYHFTCYPSIEEVKEVSLIFNDQDKTKNAEEIALHVFEPQSEQWEYINTQQNENMLFSQKIPSAFSAVAIFERPKLSIPKLLTPNGDGINDALVIEALERYPDNRIIIYSITGEKVYDAQPYRNNFTGTRLSGKLLPDGTYYVHFIPDITGFTAAAAVKSFIEIKR